MSYTPEDAWQDEAYERLVDEIIAENKHDIINDFTLERLRSYYLTNPHLEGPAADALEEAKALLPDSPTASLVFSFVSIEITLRDVLLRPVAVGLVHDEKVGALVADLVVSNRHFKKLLFHILDESGLVGLDVVRRTKDSPTVWAEKEALRQKRDDVIHRGEKATREEAEIALKIADFLLNRVYPGLRRYFGA